MSGIMASIGQYYVYWACVSSRSISPYIRLGLEPLCMVPLVEERQQQKQKLLFLFFLYYLLRQQFLKKKKPC